MKRRTFLLTAAASAAPVGRRPNVVFILADQWRAQAFGYTGDANARTPVIDALAAESVDFSNAISGFPVCSPYRASLMTGQYAVRHGLVVNDVPLAPRGATLGETFRKAGYATGYIGKWHVYGSPDGKFGRRLAFIPKESRFGFDYWKACECTHDYNRSLYYEGDSPMERHWDGYDAIAQTRDACDFIRASARKSDPYFLVLSLGPPHDPYGTAPAEYKARYANQAIALRPNVPADQITRATEDLRGYYAHMSALDDCVKQVREAVVQTGAGDDTIFVFTSDHGDMLQSQGLPRKQFPWDESIRVPFLVSYPKLLGNRRRKLLTPIDAPDIFPTLCGLAGISVPDSMQGRNFSNLITGREREPAEPAGLLNLPASFSVIRRHGFAEYRGLRTPRYTFTRSIHGAWLLYDNKTDPYQKRNLIGVKDARRLQARMERRLDEMLREAGDEFLPGQRYIERAQAAHYREVSAQVNRVRSPWGDWESTWR